mmetsp:Transcript_123463/g.354738  ORF Transcript_123463/g.354738 Transcript_123463/m.354738 type:complete len:329 (+) Transcript_123463:425-1411(+)
MQIAGAGRTTPPCEAPQTKIGPASTIPYSALVTMSAAPSPELAIFSSSDSPISVLVSERGPFSSCTNAGVCSKRPCFAEVHSAASAEKRVDGVSSEVAAHDEASSDQSGSQTSENAHHCSRLDPSISGKIDSHATGTSAADGGNGAAPAATSSACLTSTDRPSCKSPHWQPRKCPAQASAAEAHEKFRLSFPWVFEGFVLKPTSASRGTPACSRMTSTVALDKSLLGMPRTCTWETTGSGDSSPGGGGTDAALPRGAHAVGRSESGFGAGLVASSRYRAASRMSKNSRMKAPSSASWAAEMAAMSSKSKSPSPASRTVRQPVCGPGTQ